MSVYRVIHNEIMCQNKRIDRNIIDKEITFTWKQSHQYLDI